MTDPATTYRAHARRLRLVARRARDGQSYLAAASKRAHDLADDRLHAQAETVRILLVRHHDDPARFAEAIDSLASSMLAAYPEHRP